MFRASFGMMIPAYPQPVKYMLWSFSSGNFSQNLSKALKYSTWVTLSLGYASAPIVYPTPAGPSMYKTLACLFQLCGLCLKLVVFLTKVNSPLEQSQLCNEEQPGPGDTTTTSGSLDGLLSEGVQTQQSALSAEMQRQPAKKPRTAKSMGRMKGSTQSPSSAPLTVIATMARRISHLIMIDINRILILKPSSTNTMPPTQPHFSQPSNSLNPGLKLRFQGKQHYFILIIMYERCSLTESINQSQFKQMNLLGTTYPLHQTQKLLANNTVAEEVFLKSLNMSYIGHISGNKSAFKDIKFDQLQEPVVTTPKPKRKRIDFSRFDTPLSEIRESLISEEDTKFLYIHSFSKGNEQLYIETGCTQCGSFEDERKCRPILENESTFQIYVPNKQGVFDQLFLTFNFDTISASAEFSQVKQNKQLEISAGQFRIILEHDNRDVVAWWFEKIDCAISQSKGKEHSLKSLLKNELFYKQRFETEEYFFKNCETGDILLFQDDHFFAKAQRFFTRSDFDHVGMVIKDLNYGILIFEANSGSGVCLTPWRYVIKYQWYKTIPKIAWRRLKDIDKNDKFNETIQKFILCNLEKHYHISFSKIIGNQSVLRPPLQDRLKNFSPAKAENNPDDQSGFFCSELVATVYKQLGLLTRDKQSPNYQPACKFYPKDFSYKSGRKLDQGQLSPQFTIYFDDILITNPKKIEK